MNKFSNQSRLRNLQSLIQINYIYKLLQRKFIMKKICLLLLMPILFLNISCDDEELSEDLLDQDLISCQAAIPVTANAAATYASSSEENVQQNCLLYAEALQAQIVFCGDEDGALQNVINTLGDCTSVINSCDIATTSRIAAATAFANASDEEFTQFCEAYKLAIQTEITECGDPDGELQTLLDGIGDCSANQQTCESATTAVQAAEAAFNNATDEDYTSLCETYQSALQNQIVQCGDNDGAIQGIINSLGDCTNPDTGVTGQITVNSGGVQTFDVVTVVVEDGLVKVSGATSATTNDYTIYFEVAVDETGDDLLQNFELTLISSFTPQPSFVSNISVNANNVLTGTFSGLVINADNADLELNNGMIDIEY